MTRAIDQLEGRRTTEALPHEMAALQGLLQAQAEVRRREVAQQAGASMGGLGRQGQDLSALFDKELQRQQRTNYETRSQTDVRADNAGRRERARQHPRSGPPAGGVEPAAARAGDSGSAVWGRVEAAARETDARAGGASPAGRGVDAPDGPAGRPTAAGASPNPSQAGGGAMREAAEQMRSAAGELQRQSPGSAADRGEHAAARSASAGTADATR